MAQHLASPTGLQFHTTTGLADPFPACTNDRRFFAVAAERRAANDGQAQTTAPSELLNLLVRRAIAQSPRRFTGEPITGFGELA